MSYGLKLNQLDKCVCSKFDNKENDYHLSICWWHTYLRHKFVASREGKGLLIFSLQNEEYGGGKCHFSIKILKSNNQIILIESHYVEKYLSVLICLSAVQCQFSWMEAWNCYLMKVVLFVNFVRKHLDWSIINMFCKDW